MNNYTNQRIDRNNHITGTEYLRPSGHCSLKIYLERNYMKFTV